MLGGREFWKCSGNYRALGDPSRALEGNSRKRSDSVSGVFPEFCRISSRKSQPHYWGYVDFWGPRSKAPCFLLVSCNTAIFVSARDESTISKNTVLTALIFQGALKGRRT